MNAPDLLAHRFEPLPALVKPGILIRQSLSVIAGPGKLGKSLIMTNLAICLAEGTPWLGFETSRSRVLYVQAEVPPYMLQERIRRMGRAPDDLIMVSFRGVTFDQPPGFRMLRSWVMEYQPDLVVIDTLARYFSGNENSSQEMGAFIRNMDILIQEHRAAVLLIHHTGKPNDFRAGQDTVRGSSALAGAVDSILVFERRGRDRRDAKLTFDLRHDQADPLWLTRDETFWYSVVTSASSPRYAPLRTVLARGPLRWADLCRALEALDTKSRTDAAKHLAAKRLINDALNAAIITKDEATGLYALNKDHKDHISTVIPSDRVRINRDQEGDHDPTVTGPAGSGISGITPPEGGDTPIPEVTRRETSSNAQRLGSLANGHQRRVVALTPADLDA